MSQEIKSHRRIPTNDVIEWLWLDTYTTSLQLGHYQHQARERADIAVKDFKEHRGNV